MHSAASVLLPEGCEIYFLYILFMTIDVFVALPEHPHGEISGLVAIAVLLQPSYCAEHLVHPFHHCQDPLLHPLLASSPCRDDSPPVLPHASNPSKQVKNLFLFYFQLYLVSV